MKKCKRIFFTLIIIFLIIPTGLSQEDIVNGFKEMNGNEWDVIVGPWGFLALASKDIPRETGPMLMEEQAIGIAGDFLLKNSYFLGINNFTISDTLFLSVQSVNYWMVDFDGETIGGFLPPQKTIRILMTADGQVFAIGDDDMYSSENINLVGEITEDKAIESAQSGIKSDQQPINVDVINETEYGLVWNITFGEPENKEVLVDPKTGEILSIKSTDGIKALLNKILEFLKNRHSIAVIVLIITVLIGILFLKRRRRQKSMG